MAGFFLRANSPIKDWIHHVNYHNDTNGAVSGMNFELRFSFVSFTWPSLGSHDMFINQFWWGIVKDKILAWNLTWEHPPTNPILEQKENGAYDRILDFFLVFCFCG